MNGDSLETPLPDGTTHPAGEAAAAGGANLSATITPFAPPPPPPSVAVEVVHEGGAPSPILAVGPAALPASGIPASVMAPPPKPKPVIVAERVEDGWRTDRVLLDRAEDGNGYYVTVIPDTRGPLEIYVCRSALDGMIAIATSGAEP